MQIGYIISGVGHVALILATLLGGVFRSDPPAVEVRDVSVISSDAFEAILAAQRPPSPAGAVAQPPAPQEQLPRAEPPAPLDEVTVAPVPEPTPAPEPEVAPAPLEAPAEPEVATVIPAPQPPAPQVDATPDVRPIPRPAERVAPEAVAEPDPDAAPDPVTQEAVVEAETAETEAEAQEATAPEAASTEIVTEAEDAAAAAPTQSARPPAQRPIPPARTASTATDDAVTAALREALAEDAAPAAPTGPPLTGGERDALRVAVSACWNVGSLSTEALGTTVIVGVEMTRDGRPVQGSIRLVSASGGGSGAAGQAFEAARRAILRCGARGFDLPSEKYDQWREIEMTFNPERMRTR